MPVRSHVVIKLAAGGDDRSHIGNRDFEAPTLPGSRARDRIVVIARLCGVDAEEPDCAQICPVAIARFGFSYCSRRARSCAQVVAVGQAHRGDYLIDCADFASRCRLAFPRLSSLVRACHPAFRIRAPHRVSCISCFERRIPGLSFPCVTLALLLAVGDSAPWRTLAFPSFSRFRCWRRSSPRGSSPVPFSMRWSAGVLTMVCPLSLSDRCSACRRAALLSCASLS